MGWNEVEGTAKERTPYTKFAEGVTLIRVLDSEPYSFWSHWMQKQQTSVTCMGKNCPICEIIAKAKANNTPTQYNNSHRHAMRIWNYSTNKMEVMIQGKGFMSDLLALHREIGDLRTYDIKIVRNGTGKETKYTVLPTAPAEFGITEGIEEVNMAELFKPPTREEMLKLIEGRTWAEINESGEKEKEEETEIAA